MRAIYRLIVIFWVVLWINFIARDFYKGNALEDFKNLIGHNLEKRRAYIYGKGLYQLLKFAKETLPKNAEFNLVGVDKDEIGWRRAIYYLYPYIRTDDARYILVYNIVDYRKPDYAIFSRLDNRRYILKRKSS